MTANPTPIAFMALVAFFIMAFAACTEEQQLANEKTNIEECVSFCRKAGATAVATCHGHCAPSCICIYPMPPAPVSPACQTP